MADREKQYEAEKEAFTRLKKDLVDHGGGKVSDKQADQIAREIAKKADDKKHGVRRDG